MKYIGIIVSHHVNDREINLLLSGNEISEEDALRAKSYLKGHGQKFAITMQTLKSKATGEYLGGLSYYTDGFYIWPSYFLHYLENQLIGVPNEFLNYLEHLDKKTESCTNKPIDEAISFHKDNFEEYIFKLDQSTK